MTPTTTSATSASRIGKAEAIPPLSSVSKWVENVKLALIVLLVSLIIAIKLLPSSHPRPPQQEVVLATSLMGVVIAAIAAEAVAWKSRFRNQIHESVIAGKVEEINGNARIERHRKAIHSTVYLYSSFAAVLSLQLMDRLESNFHFPILSVRALDAVILATSIATISSLKPRVDADHDVYLDKFQSEIGRIIGLVSTIPLSGSVSNQDDLEITPLSTQREREVRQLQFQVVQRVLNQGSQGAGFY